MGQRRVLRQGDDSLNFVTGATGFVGSAVVRRLLAARRPVRALVRDKGKLPPDLAEAADGGLLDVREGDLLTLDRLPEALSHCSRVYHCAGARPDAPEALHMPAHGAATHNLLLTSLAVEARRVVVVSSLAVKAEKTEADSSSGGSGAPAGLDAYAASKKVQEDVVADFRRHRLPVVIVRSAPVFGPGGDSIVNRFAEQVVRGRWQGAPAETDREVSCTYVDDLAAFIVEAADKGQPGAIYEFASETVPLGQLAERIRRVGHQLGAGGGGGLQKVVARLLAKPPPFPLEWKLGLTTEERWDQAEFDIALFDAERAWNKTVAWLLERSRGR